MAKERMRNQDAHGGDVLVNDSVASGKPDLPIDRDPGRETKRGINADELGRAREPKSADPARHGTRDEVASGDVAGSIDQNED